MAGELKTFMQPFEVQPEAGRMVRVFLKDGSETLAHTTQVESSTFSGLQWYPRRKWGKHWRRGKALDVNQIKGWTYHAAL